MNAPKSLRIPLFTFDWPGACSPYAQTVEKHVIEWADHHRLIDDSDLRARTIRARYGWLAARCYPTAPLDVLETIADYIAWLFLVDDLFFDRVQTLSPRTVAHITAIIDVFDLNILQPQPIFGERALFDLCQRLRRQLGTDQFQHFAHGTRMMYCGAPLQTLAHLNSAPITLRQYECIRRQGSGLIPCMLLIECTTGTQLEADWRFSPDVQQLRDATNTIVSLSNDIHSLNVELKQPGQHKNMVTLQSGQQHELQQVIDLTAHRVLAEIENFSERSEQLLINAPPGLKQYIQGLKYWLSGHQRWVESDTLRYASEFADNDADQNAVASKLRCTDDQKTS